MSSDSLFLSLPVQHHAVDGGALAYREHGDGPPLLLVHGWPLWGVTWHRALPILAAGHRCLIVDLLGTGESRFDRATDVGMAAQARALASLLEAKGLAAVDVMAHDTGATIARLLALLAPARVGRLVLLDTEIPHHRPPMVELFARLSRWPFASRVFGALLASPRFVRSKYGFGACFADLSAIDGPFERHVVRPLATDARRREGQMMYARAIDWAAVDSLAEGHRRIRQPTLLLWGDRDPYFPPARAREMAGQLADCRGFEILPGRLFIHEERAGEVARRALRFFAEAA